MGLCQSKHEEVHDYEASGSGRSLPTVGQNLGNEEIQYLTQNTHFDEATLRMIYDVFNNISEQNVSDGLIDRQEFALAIGLNATSVLMERLFHSFSSSQTPALNFREFAMTLSVLSPQAPMSEKLRFSFDLYDINRDGNISLEELRMLLTGALKENAHVQLTDEQINELCQRTIEMCDTDGNGAIDYGEYCTLVTKNPRLLAPFTIDVSRLAHTRYQKRKP